MSKLHCNCKKWKAAYENELPFLNSAINPKFLFCPFCGDDLYGLEEEIDDDNEIGMEQYSKCRYDCQAGGLVPQSTQKEIEEAWSTIFDE